MGYERLEFLGDRVLALVISDVLLKAFPTEAEGALAKRLVGLVRRETLAEIGQELDVGAYVRLSRGEEEAGGRDNPAIVADVVEALIAAIYLDDGLAAAARFIETHWRERLERADAPPKDAKTSLQEWTQGRGVQLPEYRMVERSGPDHAPEFVIEVRVAGFGPQTGIGKTKRMAEQVAAARLLEQIGRHG